jgi:hypothetical protein
MEHATEEFYQQRITRLEELNTGLQTQLDAQTDYARDTKIESLTSQVADLTNSASEYRQSYYSMSSNKQGLVDNMKEWTFKNLEEGAIDEDVALEIAEIMGFELEEEFNAEVSVTFNLTIMARNREAALEVANDAVDYESVNYDSDLIQYLSASIDRVDI